MAEMSAMALMGYGVCFLMLVSGLLLLWRQLKSPDTQSE